jgi:hypothetical protein
MKHLRKEKNGFVLNGLRARMESKLELAGMRTIVELICTSLLSLNRVELKKLKVPLEI